MCRPSVAVTAASYRPGDGTSHCNWKLKTFWPPLNGPAAVRYVGAATPAAGDSVAVTSAPGVARPHINTLDGRPNARCIPVDGTNCRMKQS
ncbi:MAG: hypothetical protein AB1416_03200, partial [Actinomycetota bacterium]